MRRRTDATQVLQLLTGELVNEMLSAPDNRIGRSLAAQKSDREIMEELFVAAFCRLPRTPSSGRWPCGWPKPQDRRAGLEDVTWAVVTSKEFWLRR